MNRFPQFLLTSTAALMAFASAEVPSLKNVPKYQTPVPIPESRIWHITYNLGPTGARGWLYGPDGHSRDSREILIKSIEPGSPADGVLELHDLIIGAAVPPETPSTEWRSAPAVKPFDSDARMSLARAVTWAESDQGKGQLRLLRLRNGEQKQVVVPIQVMGSYSATAPFDCPKSSKIVEQAGRFLADSMPADGYSSGIGRPLNAMFLLATENADYLDHVRRSACRMSINHTISDAGHETWRWGNTNLFLCEYYLATGDARVLPSIQEYCTRLAEGQCNPGTWGHRVVPDFIPPGYGSLNSTGLVCFLSMILGESCGVKVDHQALANSIRFYGSYAGRGGIPYGDHPPTYDASSNGKNGMAAVAFHMLDADPAAQWFARMAGSSNLLAFEGGHTGNFFNQTWTPLGASLAGRDNYAAFWARFNSYRDLCRRPDGSFIAQPFPQKREGDLGTGNYVSKGPIWNTGGFALSYLADTRRLAVLGRTDSVFSAYAPDALRPALDLYEAKKFDAAASAAAELASSSDARVRRLAQQLKGISERNQSSIASTLADMARSLETGDLYKIKVQLQAIESVVDADDPRLAKFRRAVDDPANAVALEEGQRFHASNKQISYTGPKGFQWVTAPGSLSDRRTRDTMRFLAERGKSAYRDMAAAHVAAAPSEPAIADTPLVPGKDKGSPVWRMMPATSEAKPNWREVTFDDSQWKPLTLPSREVADKRLLRASFEIDDPAAVESLLLDYLTGGEMLVHLNGTLILHLAPEGGPSKYDRASIPLKSSTLELLRAGRNTLAVATNHPKAGDPFNLTLKAAIK
ncbi:DUF6288 domain-containing protein [Haloferula sp. A504]|uniref:DUF6288 domain-containing protein n=1 Tax=Haloferula sp. A504 TaxID=3373601 RepID=UPI0031BE7DDB|nr:DUF6288 domain-containing protein [Verrucomicrobiaceae bacterium E54]